MTTVSENPAVTDPHKALSPAERRAVLAVGFYRNHRQYGTTWMIGDKRFPSSTIEALAKKSLIKAHQSGRLDLTMAGTIARDKLKEVGHGS